MRVDGCQAHRRAASSSMAVSGLRKLVTSAMWTPTSTLPPGSDRTCSASSMSLHPGGSTLQTHSPRRSSLPTPCERSAKGSHDTPNWLSVWRYDSRHFRWCCHVIMFHSCKCRRTGRAVVHLRVPKRATSVLIVRQRLAPVGILDVCGGDSPWQRRHARMYCRAEGAGVDVILHQQYLRRHARMQP